jgi:quercetin dioxygenase-like cupin family protein
MTDVRRALQGMPYSSRMTNDTTATIPAAQALALSSLITTAGHGIASRILAKTPGGSVTLFAFDSGQGLEEHTSPFDALVLVLEGELALTIGGVAARALPGTVVRMPGGVPHALTAREECRMLLVMLREAPPKVS